MYVFADVSTLEKFAKIFTQLKPKLFNKDLLRSSRPEVFCKKGVLRNFAKFTGKHLCQSLFFKYSCRPPATLCYVFL